MATAVQAYYGITVTLADTNPHNLLALLQAIDSSLLGVLQSCQTLKIQADDSNNNNAVRIGDADVSLTRCAYRLLVHEQVPYSLISYQTPLAAVWVMAEGATCKLNVEITF